MNEICIHLPDIEPRQTLELEVTLNGKKRMMNYRIETVDWSAAGPSTPHRIAHLRAFIDAYDPAWDLVQIGTPDAGGHVPVMFRQRLADVVAS